MGNTEFTQHQQTLVEANKSLIEAIANYKIIKQNFRLPTDKQRFIKDLEELSRTFHLSYDEVDESGLEDEDFDSYTHQLLDNLAQHISTKVKKGDSIWGNHFRPTLFGFIPLSKPTESIFCGKGSPLYHSLHNVLDTINKQKERLSRLSDESSDLYQFSADDLEPVEYDPGQFDNESTSTLGSSSKSPPHSHTNTSDDDLEAESSLDPVDPDELKRIAFFNVLDEYSPLIPCKEKYYAALEAINEKKASKHKAKQQACLEDLIYLVCSQLNSINFASEIYFDSEFELFLKVIKVTQEFGTVISQSSDNSAFKGELGRLNFQRIYIKGVQENTHLCQNFMTELKSDIVYSEASCKVGILANDMLTKSVDDIPQKWQLLKTNIDTESVYKSTFINLIIELFSRLRQAFYTTTSIAEVHETHKRRASDYVNNRSGNDHDYIKQYHINYFKRRANHDASSIYKAIQKGSLYKAQEFFDFINSDAITHPVLAEEFNKVYSAYPLAEGGTVNLAKLLANKLNENYRRLIIKDDVKYQDITDFEKLVSHINDTPYANEFRKIIGVNYTWASFKADIESRFKTPNHATAVSANTLGGGIN